MRMTAIFGAVASLALASSAMAGFTAGTGPDPFVYTGAGTATVPATGGNIAVSNQPLESYTPDGAADPQIVPGDLSNFLFSLNVTANATLSGGTTVLASGTYSLFYDLGSNGTPDIRVSSGTASLFLQQTAPGIYSATGTLTQILGPANPAFRDLAYGNNANFILQGGLYLGAGAGGTLNLVLRQNAVVPEPVSIGSIAAAGLLVARRRRA